MMMVDNVVALLRQSGWDVGFRSGQAAEQARARNSWISSRQQQAWPQIIIGLPIRIRQSVPWPRRGVARQRMNGSLRLRYRHGYGHDRGAMDAGESGALDTPDQVVTCRAVCTVPLAGATCPWRVAKPARARGIEENYHPPRRDGRQNRASRARITRGED